MKYVYYISIIVSIANMATSAIVGHVDGVLGWLSSACFAIVGSIYQTDTKNGK